MFISGTLTSIIQNLEASRDKGYPEVIKPYEGELLNLAEHAGIAPAVLVNMRSGRFDGVEHSNTYFRFSNRVEFICLDINHFSGGEQNKSIHKLIEWVVDSMRGWSYQGVSLDGDGGFDIVLADKLSKESGAMVFVGLVTLSTKEIS